MEERPPIDLVRPPSLAAGVPYAYAAAPHGRSLYVFTAGACPLDGSGAMVAAGDLAAQSAQVMDNLGVALRVAGADAARRREDDRLRGQRRPGGPRHGVARRAGTIRGS